MKLKFRFPEAGEAPTRKPGHYQFESLNAPEKMMIRLVYWKQWRRLVNASRFSKNQTQYAKRYFYELHARYYRTVIQGGQYVTVSRLIRNFFLSKAQENLRTVLASLNPYNLTSFVQGLRSQIEINALLHKFIVDPEYHKEHFLLNEDRRRVKEVRTTININTLVDGLDKIGSPLPYAEIYDELSLLLHPNPSAMRFYAQAERLSQSDYPLPQPKIKFYFDETICHTQAIAEKFSKDVWFLLTSLEHFLFLFDSLKAEFYINSKEEKDHQEIAMATFVAHNEAEILQAANRAHRAGDDVQEAVSEVVTRLMNEQNAKASSKGGKK